MASSNSSNVARLAVLWIAAPAIAVIAIARDAYDWILDLLE